MASQLVGCGGDEYSDTAALYSRLGAVWVSVHVGFYPFRDDNSGLEVKEIKSAGNTLDAGKRRGQLVGDLVGEKIRVVT